MVTNEEIKGKNYSFSAGQYFEVKIDYIEISEDEFKTKLGAYQKEIKSLWSKTHQLEAEICKSLEGLQYED